MLTNPRKLHRFLVPFVALPLIITASTGTVFSLLERRAVDADWLLEIHKGHFDPLNLTPYDYDVYSLILSASAC